MKSFDAFESFSVTEARKDFGNIFNEVNYQGKRVIITSHKKRVAIVPIEDLQILEDLEDEIDVKEAKLALKEVEKEGTISFEEMLKLLKEDDKKKKLHG